MTNDNLLHVKYQQWLSKAKTTDDRFGAYKKGMEDGMRLKDRFFLVLEGINGAGKTTLAKALAQKVLNPVLTREPGGTSIGRNLRTLLIENDLSDEAAMFLMWADRALHKSMLTETKGFVICDRYNPSTEAFQIANLPSRLVALSKQVQEQFFPVPDLSVYIDITPEEAYKRNHADASKLDKFDKMETNVKAHRSYESQIFDLRVSGFLSTEQQVKEILEYVPKHFLLSEQAVNNNVLNVTATISLKS